MGWWQTVSGAVIGDPAADYVDNLIAQGKVYVEPAELPPEVRKRLIAIYVEGLGREPTDDDLQAVLGFCLRVTIVVSSARKDFEPALGLCRKQSRFVVAVNVPSCGTKLLAVCSIVVKRLRSRGSFNRWPCSTFGMATGST
ncbi:MAG: hypothetical protein HY287_07315 [Planctomycetes bacterium]|nr:hypothetical protein [Planctomycetota bacterium]